VNQRNRITDAFIDSLAMIEGVRVGPRKSGWVARDETELRTHVRTNFHVGHVLTGKVGTPPGRVEIELTLYQAEGDRLLWTETFTGGSNEVVALERRGLERIAATLGLSLTEEEQRQIDRKLTNNFEAFRAVRQAHTLWNLSTRENYTKILNLFYRALELDPLYLDAENGAGFIHRHLGWDRPPSETWTIIRHRARRVLEVDDTHGGARYSLWSVTHVYDWDWEKADAMYAEYMADYPHSESVRWVHLAHYHMNLGRFDVAEVEWAKAVEADPAILNKMAPRHHWLSFFWATRRYEEGLRGALEALKAHPGSHWAYYWIVASATGLGDYRRAIDAAQEGLAIEDRPHMQAFLGYAYGRMGDRPKALEVLQRLEAMSTVNYQPYIIARVHAGLGQKDEAFAWLEKAVGQRCEELMHISGGGLMTDPAWDDLRDDPRFFELRKKVGLDVWPRPTRTIPASLQLSNAALERVLP
jgi:tetratricopeptide (TPR) repeat protein